MRQHLREGDPRGRHNKRGWQIVGGTAHTPQPGRGEQFTGALQQATSSAAKRARDLLTKPVLLAYDGQGPIRGTSPTPQPPVTPPGIQERLDAAAARARDAKIIRINHPRPAAGGGGERTPGRWGRRLRTWVGLGLLSTTLGGAAQAVPQVRTWEGQQIQRIESTLSGKTTGQGNGEQGKAKATPPAGEGTATATPTKPKSECVASTAGLEACTINGETYKAPILNFTVNGRSYSVVPSIVTDPTTKVQTIEYANPTNNPFGFMNPKEALGSFTPTVEQNGQVGGLRLHAQVVADLAATQHKQVYAFDPRGDQITITDKPSGNNYPVASVRIDITGSNTVMVNPFNSSTVEVQPLGGGYDCLISGTDASATYQIYFTGGNLFSQTKLLRAGFGQVIKTPDGQPIPAGSIVSESKQPNNTPKPLTTKDFVSVGQFPVFVASN